MKVGLTYDLRSEYLKAGYSEEETAEFDKEDTIEGIESALQRLGHSTYRIGNIKSLVNLLNNGQTWDIIFNIAEGLHGISREAQVPAILDAFKIPYVFSNPLVLAATLHKGVTKRLIRDMGLPTPDFHIVESVADINNVNLKYPLFAKPIAEGTGKGISANSKVNNKIELQNICTELLQKFNQPVLVETYLPGREFTVGVIGNGKSARVIGAMEIIYSELAEQDVYSFYNKENYENIIQYVKVTEKDILNECTDLALKIWNGLGCNDGGRMDLRMDENGKISFIEINPLAGLRPIHSDLIILAEMNNIKYNDLIAMIFKEALERLHLD